MLGAALVVVGAPGAGATSVGAALARALSRDFVDVGALIEAQAELTTDEIFAVEGESGYRARERDAALAAVREPGAVVALTSGAILDEAVRDALAEVAVLWLQVDATHSSRRSGLSAIAPAMFGGMRAQLIRQIAEREPLYAGVATAAIDTSALTLDEVVAAATDLAGRLVAPQEPGA